MLRKTELGWTSVPQKLIPLNFDVEELNDNDRGGPSGCMLTVAWGKTGKTCM